MDTQINKYGVIDLARAVPLRSMIVRLEPPDADFLLHREAFSDLMPVGPWLVDLARNKAVVRKWRKEGRWQSWGYIVQSALNLKALRGHFRKFNMVEIEGRDEPVFFRYFDAKVLNTFIAEVSNVNQRIAMLAPISSISIEDPKQRNLVEYDAQLWTRKAHLAIS